MSSHSYTPVPYDYRETIEEEIVKNTSGKIFFFNEENMVDDTEGRIVTMEERSMEGIFIKLDFGKEIRIDRIITLFGKPGAACDEYYAYGNTCLDCKGGYDFDS